MLKIRMHHSKRKGAGTLIKEVLAYSSRCCAWRLQPIVALESAYWLSCGGCLASIGRGLLSLRSIRPFSPHSQQNTHQSAGPQQENPAELRVCVMCVCEFRVSGGERDRVDQLLLNHCRSTKSGTVTDTEGEREKTLNKGRLSSTTVMETHLCGPPADQTRSKGQKSQPPY